MPYTVDVTSSCIRSIAMAKLCSYDLFIWRRVTQLTKLLQGQTSVDMEPGHLAFTCSTYCSFMKYVPASKHSHVLHVGKSSSRLAEFPGQSVCIVKYVA